MINIDLAKFENPKLIKIGGYGRIYQVKEKSTSNIYVAKVIHYQNENSNDNKLIYREIEILMLTKHPTIINMIGFTFHDSDWIDIKNNVTIIMQYCKNGSLSELLSLVRQGQASMEYDDTSRQIILTGIARGMKYLHNRNIIHRDLNPNNVLLDENFHPLISDFGLSKIYQDGQSHKHSQNLGTFYYMAPEFIKSNEYDTKVDVYSFAIIMYEVVTDSIPYPDHKKGNFDFENKVINNNYRPKFSKPIKPSIQKLIEQCWSHDPNERPTFDHIFDKLAFSDGKEVDDEDSYYLSNVNLDIFQDYLDDIIDANDPVERLSNQIKKVEKANEILITEKKQLKVTNQQLNNEIRKFAAENEQLISENEKLKEEIEKLKREKININNDQQLVMNDEENKFEEEEEENEICNKDNEKKIEEEEYSDEEIDFLVQDKIDTTITSNDFIVFNLSEKNRTAFIDKSLHAKGNIFIPKKIKYSENDYEIIGINDEAFKETNIQILDFAEDSSVQYIGNFVFKNSTIEKIYIPSSLRSVSQDWIRDSKHLQSIEIKQKNRHFVNKEGLIFYIRNHTNTIVFSPPGISGEYLIPKEVTHVGVSAFENHKELQSIVANNSMLREIGQYSFSRCQKLAQVHINVQSPIILNESCFSESIGLINVELESNEVVIGKKSFYKCSSLKTVNFTKVENIDLNSHAFYRCSKLSNFSINNESEQKSNNISNSSVNIYNLESINIFENCFVNCSLITSIIIFGVKKVNLSTYSFRGIQNLNTFEIKKSTIVKIPKLCFSELQKLSSLSFDSNNILIENNFYKECPLLNSLTISSQVDLVIFPDMLKDCTTITFLKIKSDSRLKLCKDCFKDLKNLKNIEISFKSIQIYDKDNVFMDDGIFNDCKSLNELRLITDSKFQIKNPFMNNFPSLRNLFLNGDKISVENGCFSKCSSLNHLYISKSNDIMISNNEFLNYANLQSITIESKRKNNSAEIPKFIFNPNCFSFLKHLDTITLIGGEVAINNGCMKNCKSLQKVYFRSIEKVVIEAKQFSSMRYLETVDIESKICTKLGTECFQGSNVLKSVLICSRDIIIEDECFQNSSLEKINLSNAENVMIGSSVFSRCSNLSIIFIKASSRITIGDNCFKGTNILEAIFNCKGINLGENCFKSCSSLQKLEIVSTDDIILSNMSFEGCKKLKNIILFSSSRLIMLSSCFSGDKNLETIEIKSANYVIIGSQSFYNCSSLKYISFPKSDSIILEENAFCGCEKLKEININAQLEFQAGINCFSKCNCLDKLNITSGKILIEQNCFPNSSICELTIIASGDVTLKEKAFESCNKLNQVFIKSRKILISENVFRSTSIKELTLDSQSDITLKENAFYGCRNLNKVKIKSEGNISILYSCFYSNINLLSVEIEGRDIYTGTYSFSNCASLLSLKLTGEENVTFDNRSFEGCSSISSLIINSRFSFTANYCCFDRDIKLENITINSFRVYFGNFCLYSCSSLKSVECPSANIIHFDNTAFNGSNKNINYKFNDKAQKVQNYVNVLYPKITI